MPQVLCTWVCMGLDDSTCSEFLPEGTCHFKPTEHVPWTSARAQTCARGPGGVPACSLPATEPRARGKTHGRKRTKFRSAKNMHLCIVIQVSPSGCVRIEIPRVTQVNEKGHEGNTAVVTAYFEVYDKMKKCQL